MAFVSVVVPTYNRLRHLKQCLASVAAQTYTDWECLVCDDGSTDGTRDHVRDLALRDSRFRLSLGKRYGLPAGPRNRGIAESRGNWIAFVDDDDLWHPAKLELQLDLAGLTSAGAVATRLVMFNEGCAPDWEERDAATPHDELFLENVLRLEPPFPSISTNLICREALVRLRGFAQHPAYRALEDYDMWCRLLALDGFRWFVAGGSPLTAMRQAGADSISSWRRVPAPEFVRQRWSMLEVASRILAANQTRLDHARRTLLLWLATQADGIAHRSRLLGWRREAITAYRLAARFIAACGDGAGASMRLIRAVRFGMLGRATEPATLDPSVPILRERAQRYATAIINGQTLVEDPLPVDQDGSWSSGPIDVA